MNKRILSPSFSIERKTKALNGPLWGFVALISMFTVGVGVMCSHIMVTSVTGITGTIISEYFALFAIAPMLAMTVVFGVGFFFFLIKLLRSYRIEKDRIIEGKMIGMDEMDGVDLAINAAFLSYVASHIGDSAVSGAYGLTNLRSLMKKIKFNMMPGFAEEFFDTDMYRKKEYINPKLIKDGKYTMTFMCDGGKKLKISKFYTNMGKLKPVGREHSMVSRVLAKSLLVFLVCALLSGADLMIGKMLSGDRVEAITSSREALEADMDDFCYVSHGRTESDFVFEKCDIEDRISTVRVGFDDEGNMTYMDFDMYFDADSLYTEDELRYMLSTAYPGLADDEISSFIESVKKTVSGENDPGTLETDGDTVRIGTSGGAVEVHN